MAGSRKTYNCAFTVGAQVLFFVVEFFSFATAVRLCQSETCNRLSAEIRSNMNTSVDPCENFFQYACGGWIAAHPVPQGFKRFSRLNIMHQELQVKLRELLEEPIKPTDNSGEKAVKQQFQLCMNEYARNQDSIIQLLNIIENVGPWPMIRTSGSQTRTWQQIHDQYNRMTGRPSLYAITVYTNHTRATINSIFLDQPESIFDARLRRQTAEEVLKYMDFLTAVVMHFAAVAGSPVPEESIRQDLETVYSFRDKLEKLTTKFLVRRRGPVMSINQAQEFLNNATYGVQQIDVFAAIQAAYSIVKDVTVPLDEMIHVREPQYLKGLVQLLTNTPINVILNHINLHFVENHLLHTTTHHRRLLAEVYGPEGDRVTYCTNMPNIQVALSGLYIKKYFSAEQRAAVVEIVENVKDAIKRQMRRTDWLNSEALNSSLDKIEKLNQIIGYSNAIANDTEVEAYYAEYNMGDNYIQNVVNYEGIEYSRLLRTLRHRTAEDLKKRPQLWPVNVMSVYRALFNRFELPAALMRWPYYNIDLPHNVNYATIGTIIGLTLASMYDSIGYYLDQTGNYRITIIPESDDAHDNSTWCFERQYTDYVRNYLNGTGITYNDRNSFLAQTTHDSFGLSAALEAYEAKSASEGDEFKILPYLDDYNQMRQFFLAFAGSNCEAVSSGAVHSMIQNSRRTIAELRVNFAVSNLAVFSNTFNCPPGSPMNLAEKCAIFDPPHM